MGKVQQRQDKSKPSRLNFVDEGSQTKGAVPLPGAGQAEEKKRKPQKLKSDAQKAKERAEQLRFGKAEITVDEASRMTKETKSGNVRFICPFRFYSSKRSRSTRTTMWASRVPTRSKRGAESWPDGYPIPGMPKS